MAHKMTVTTSFGSCVTTGHDRRDFRVMGEFVAGMAEAEPNESFTLRAENGPDFDGFYGDIVSVSIEVAR